MLAKFVFFLKKARIVFAKTYCRLALRDSFPNSCGLSEDSVPRGIRSMAAVVQIPLKAGSTIKHPPSTTTKFITIKILRNASNILLILEEISCLVLTQR
jgi:hypothetical protein